MPTILHMQTELDLSQISLQGYLKRAITLIMTEDFCILKLSTHYNMIGRMGLISIRICLSSDCN